MPKHFLHPIIILVFSLSYGGYLALGSHPFWDDWILINKEPVAIINTFRQAGSYFNFLGHLHASLLAIGPWIYRPLTLVLWFLTGYLFWRILCRSGLFSRNESTLIALLCIILPLNASKAALIIFPYTLCLFLFMLAWAVMPSSRFLSGALFFISFNTNSLLVFYALPLLEMINTQCAKKSLSSRPLNFFLANTPWLLLPLTYFISKNLFFRPYAAYVGYNENFSIKNLIVTPIKQIGDLFLAIANTDPSALTIAGTLLILLFAAINIGCIRYFKDKRIQLGLLALSLALFPYYILGLTPRFAEWSNRHQLLIPFGLSVLTVCSISLLPKPKQNSIIAILIATCIFSNLFNSVQLVSDSRKQDYITDRLASILRDSTPSLVIVNDKTNNALHRKYRFYEINGMLSKATKGQSWFGVTTGEYADYKKGRLDKFFTDQYNAASHSRDPKTGAWLITIQDTDYFQKLVPFHPDVCATRLLATSILDTAKASECNQP